MRVRLVAVASAWLLALPVQARIGPQRQKNQGWDLRLRRQRRRIQRQHRPDKEGVCDDRHGQTPVDSLAAMGTSRSSRRNRALCHPHRAPRRSYDGISCFRRPQWSSHTPARRVDAQGQRGRAKPEARGRISRHGEAMRATGKSCRTSSTAEDDAQPGPSRSFELMVLKNVHSEADTAIWLPRNGCSGPRQPWGSNAIPISGRSSRFRISSPPSS